MAQTTSVIIGNGTSDSAAIPLGNLSLVGISVPTITSAAITLRVSSDGGTTYQGAFNTTGEILEAASTGNYYLALNPIDTFGMDMVKIRSGNNAGGTTQGADRTFTLHFRSKQ